MYDEEDWAVIEEFPTYSVSTLGQVMNNDTRRIMHMSRTPRGAVKVGLVKAGQQQTRSVKVLVAEAFVPGRTDIFDTPINLDGDRTNNTVDNIAWRPRWFAVKYSRQFLENYPHSVRGPIRDLGNGDIYPTVHDAATANGLLIKDVFAACLNGDAVFPTWQTFEWIR